MSGRRRSLLLVAGVALVAVNLRPAVASVGPVLHDLQDALRLSGAEAAALTTAPVLCFGLAAPLGPWLGRRLGMHRTLGVVLVVIAAGLLLRVVAGVPALYAGTVVAATGIAAANVVVPALVKRDFPTRIGLMMGVYTTALTGAAALAAGVTVPAMRFVGHGWRGGLAIWVLPALVAIIVWLPQVRPGVHDVPASTADALPGSVLRDRVAWQVTTFFGLQSLSFYAVLSWLPTLYRDHGYSAAAAGGLLSLSTIVQMPVALVLPTLATRRRNQRGLLAWSVGLTAVGLAGVLAAPTAAPYLWVVVLGVGQGAAFPIALTLLVLRAPDSHVAAQLSAMAQTVGYVIAGLGPLAVGAVHDVTGSWPPAIGLLLALLVPQLVAGLEAARDRLVSAPGH